MSNCNCSATSNKEEQISDKMEKERKTIREQYGRIARDESKEFEEKNIDPELQNNESPLYSEEQMKSIPKGSNLGLGSGNPIALANVQVGETVVDLGSGAGVDCFLAANKIGPKGKVIGVDMTADMISLARENALKGNYKNVEFRLGEIEHLPIADNSTDLIISNCVINLASDKNQVFKEAFRVLKPGGRIVISDIMFSKKLPEKVSMAFKGMASCVSRAVVVDEYLDIIRKAGFVNVGVINEFSVQRKEQGSKKKKLEKLNKITIISDGNKLELELTPEEVKAMDNAIISAHVKAVKPN